MKVACNAFVGNRKLSTLSVNQPRKYSKSTIALCKHPNSNEYCIILFTSQNKTGVKYNIKGNIKKVLTKFLNEGKCTIQLFRPEHDLFIIGDVIQLKGFLHLLRRVLENKISEKELSISSMAVTPVKRQDIAPTKLFITQRGEYPTKGFPRTLEELHINDIRRCGVDRGILQLIKLRVLDLSQNCIESIPEDLNQLPNLKEVNLSHNSLGKSTSKQWNWLGGSLSRTLLLLDLSYNEIADFPNQISKLHKLATLNASNNSLKTLPAGIGNLKNLKIFSAANNTLTMLPGSIKKLRLQSLDVSNNSFEQCLRNSNSINSNSFPVCTLKEYSARKILGVQIPYPPGSVPSTVNSYLDNAKYCICGRACFDVFFRSFRNLLLTNIAESVSTAVGEIMYAPIDCYFCSLKCFASTFVNRTRNPIVR